MGVCVDRLNLYTEVAQAASADVIRQYSTSFGMASRVLKADSRRHISNIYALVRIADEIVDGVAAEAGLTPDAIRTILDDCEKETEIALHTGYSSNLVIHAFATTARAVGITTAETAPFFASMRMDLTDTEYDEAGFARYVYGSAEVVGLMCLAVFVRGRNVSADEGRLLVKGARALGAAFQKVNFLRDLSADAEGLGRSYFPGVTAHNLDEITKVRLVDDIDADLAAANATLRLLPDDAARAVALAHDFFAELSRRIRSTPADQLLRARISVPNPTKYLIAARIMLGFRSLTDK
ncbi:MAG: hypothetical protein RIS25_1154 [Actinomycetota bacterium]|jgi:15-cis-phytoene synthase